MIPIDLTFSDLHATVRLADDVLHLALAGTADATTESALNALLTRLNGECRRSAVRAAHLDLRALEFMNSSCLKAFITWIVAVDRLPAAERYHFRFIYNSAYHWQKRSLRAMIHFGGDIVSVESE